MKQMIKCGRPTKGMESLNRDRLLDTALKLFLEHGYGKLNMETIAREAQVSLRTIYSQFGSKAGLFGAVIRRCSDQLEGYLAEEGNTEEILVNFAQGFLQRITRPDVVRMRAILVGEAPHFSDLARQFYAQGPQRTLELLMAFFSKRQQSGEFLTLEPRFLAEQFVSALRGERLHQLQLGLIDTPDESEIRQWAEQATHLFLYGCIAKQ